MTDRLGWTRGAIAVSVAAVLALGCQDASGNDESGGSPPTTITTTEAGETPSNGAEPSDDGASVDRAELQVEPLDWQPCDGTLECGSVEVPVDYDDPAAGSIPISVIRRPALGDADGTVFVNPGGPGASGVEFVRNGFTLDDETAARYHVVGFDPRGIGGSAALTCGVDRATGPLPDLSPDTAAEEEELRADAETIVRRCVADDGALLPHLTTLNVARDLDRLRRAVGDDKLNFLGLSYGTLLGARYLQLFPENVGRLVLDGVVDPDRSLTDLLTQQAQAFEAAFPLLQDRCVTDGPCPDGGVLATFDRLHARLEANGPVDGVGSSELVMASLLPLYNPAFWPSYRAALIDADAGQTPGLGRLSDLFTTAISFTAYASFACADTVQPASDDAWQGFVARLEAEAPRFGAVIGNELRVCANWPQPATDPDYPEAPPPIGSLAEPGDEMTADSGSTPTVLVIGTTGDTATPFDNAERLARELPAAHLVVVDGLRHTGYSGSSCVRDLVADYLAGRLTEPGRSNCPVD